MRASEHQGIDPFLHQGIKVGLQYLARCRMIEPIFLDQWHQQRRRLAVDQQAGPAQGERVLIGVRADRATGGDDPDAHRIRAGKCGFHARLDHPATRQVLQTYLAPLVDKGIDTLMLACTHYPLLIPVLKDLLPADVRLVDSATTCAEHLKKELTRLGLLEAAGGEGSLEIHLTDLSEEFEVLARQFLSKSPGRIHRAVLGG